MKKKENEFELAKPIKVNAQLSDTFRMWTFRKLTVFVAASAAIIATNSTAGLACPPIEKNAQTLSSIVKKTDQATPPRSNTKFNLTDYSFMIATAALLPLAIMLSYSLMTRGKFGTGWKAVCLTAAAVTFVTEIAILIFCEIAKENGVQDWDC
jgi:hypothetical protein